MTTQSKPSEAQLRVLADHVDAKCSYCDAWNPVTLDPIGPECGQPVVEVIFWKDRRYSPSCAEHGFKALTRDAKALVLCVATTTTAGGDAEPRGGS